MEIISDMWDTLALCSKTLDLWLVLAKENLYRRFSGGDDSSFYHLWSMLDTEALLGFKS